MKGLLHSKRFRRNLAKWLFMYIGVMGLLTTVITYSKYISSMMTQDESRASKFNVSIKSCSDETCETEADINTITAFRPSSTQDYYFKVDTSELEVMAQLYLTINVHPHFKVVEVKNVTEDTEPSYTSKLGSDDRKILTIEDLVLTNRVNNVTIYKLSVAYDMETAPKCSSEVKTNCIEVADGLPRYKFENNNSYKLISIDYIAEQVKN